MCNDNFFAINSDLRHTNIVTKLLFLLFVSFFTFVANNSFAAIVTIDGTFSNITSDPPGGTNDDPDCFDSRQPITAPITGANPFNNQIRYGNPFGGGFGFGCANTAANFENKSRMGHQGGDNIDLNCPNPGSANPVSLGEFTHYNNDLSILNPNDRLTGFDLTITINCMSSDDLGQLVLKIKRDYPIISLA